MYTQISTSTNSTREVLKIKETFPNLPTKKIKNIQRIISSKDKTKPKLHITMKGLFHKQVIIPMSNDNKTKFMLDLSSHIININRALKNIKSEIKADFVWSKQSDIVITTNKITTQLNLQTIEQYVRSTNHIKAKKIKTPCLPQLKSYLKITGIPYLLENTNFSIIADVIKAIIKNNHIFNNITIASRSRVIKISSKSDMAIIWLDI